MRLINVKTLTVNEFPAYAPPYIIASHRWGKNEPTFQTFVNNQKCHIEALEKVVGFCEAIKAHDARIKWLWIDTVCIDVSIPALIEYSCENGLIS
jgi:hypothetical protein